MGFDSRSTEAVLEIIAIVLDIIAMIALVVAIYAESELQRYMNSLRRSLTLMECYEARNIHFGDDDDDDGRTEETEPLMR